MKKQFELTDGKQPGACTGCCFANTGMHCKMLPEDARCTLKENLGKVWTEVAPTQKSFLQKLKFWKS